MSGRSSHIQTCFRCTLSVTVVHTLLRDIARYRLCCCCAMKSCVNVNFIVLQSFIAWTDVHFSLLGAVAMWLLEQCSALEHDMMEP